MFISEWAGTVVAGFVFSHNGFPYIQNAATVHKYEGTSFVHPLCAGGGGAVHLASFSTVLKFTLAPPSLRLRPGTEDV